MSADDKQNRTDNGTDRLQEIRARLDAATPGPWRSRPRSNAASHTIYRGRLEIAWTVYAQEDADLVANAPTDLAWCLAEIERLRRLAACPDCDYMDGGKPCAYCASVHQRGAG